MTHSFSIWGLLSKTKLRWNKGVFTISYRKCSKFFNIKTNIFYNIIATKLELKPSSISKLKVTKWYSKYIEN